MKSNRTKETEKPETAASYDPITFARNLADVAVRSQHILQEFLQRQEPAEVMHAHVDPFNIGGAFLEMCTRMMADPTKLAEQQVKLWKDYMQLWQYATARFLGQPDVEPPAPPIKDKRFKDPAWQENAVFDFIRQSYLLTANWMNNMAKEVEGLDPKVAQKVDFYTRQFTDALSPSNFIMTNPEVLKATLESNGENLVKGLQNLLEDIEEGKGKLKISMTDNEAFEVGVNLALTPGKVVYENELMQLIQYEPTTAKVYEAPILMIPAWINKFYILDLQPENSIVKWLVGQGYTVFVISWANPDEQLAKKTFDDYLKLGPISALDAIEKLTGETKVNAVGYCLGGTLLSITLAWLNANKHKGRIASATYLTTLIDFTEAGDLSVFIDEDQLKHMESRLQHKGYLEGRDMAATFSMLRSNDLIWSFVVNNYLLGKEPFPFDLLYWNSDSTHMPAAMHLYYLRNMYQQNNLIKPGALKLLGTPIDIYKNDVPAFILSTREDHIAPWKSTYAATQIYAGDVEFVLSASGHIAGVINPPVKEKYCYWTNDRLPKAPDQWLESAKEHPGSWWTYWEKWLRKNSGKQVAARKPAVKGKKKLEVAPGRYVKVKS